MSASDLTSVLQLGIVTSDLDLAMRVWTEKYGVGSWNVVVLERDSTTGTTGDGEPAWLEARIGATFIGGMSVELIEPTSAEGIYAESLERHGGADHIHHLLFGCAEQDFSVVMEDFERKGVRPMQSGHSHASALDYAYLDTESDLGFVLEFVHMPGWTPESAGAPTSDANRAIAASSES